LLILIPDSAAVLVVEGAEAEEATAERAAALVEAGVVATEGPGVVATEEPGAALVVAVLAPEGARSAQAKCTEILNTNNPG
jgi:hypothetical protein